MVLFCLDDKSGDWGQVGGIDEEQQRGHSSSRKLREGGGRRDMSVPFDLICVPFGFSLGPVGGDEEGLWIQGLLGLYDSVADCSGFS